MNIQHFANKWIMRVKEARTVLTVVLWGIMAVVQVMDFLRPYLTQNQLIGVALGMAASFGIIFPYLYDVLGIMRGEQVQRVRRRDNFVGEQLVLQHLGNIHIFSEAFEKDEEEMMDNYKEFLENYQNGVDIQNLNGEGNGE